MRLSILLRPRKSARERSFKCQVVFDNMTRLEMWAEATIDIATNAES